MGNEGVKSPQAMENMGKLAILMGRAGLTTKELSQRTGICIKSLYDYRRGKHMPALKEYNALAKVFGWERLKPKPKKKAAKKTYEARKIITEEALPLPKPVKFEFEEGRTYRIYDSPKQQEDGVNVFIYKGKHGVHHCFRQVRGGWTRTYTDAQLLGKLIKEEE